MPIGTLQIFTSLADEAKPLANVIIRVFKSVDGDIVFDEHFITDLEGLSPIITLETKNRDLSLDENNRERPYEIYNYEPLLSHKSGQSFPSRHTLSAVIIALVCYDIHMILGIVMLVLACIIALSRIIAGLHHISDVIVAIIFAFLIYTL